MLPDEGTTSDAPLSMSEAIAAYTAQPPEASEEEQTDEADEQEGESAEDELPPEEVGEDEGEPDDEDQAEGEEDGESDEDVSSDQGRFVSDNAKVRLADGTVTTIAELKAGSLKNADYTQKTQALAAEKQQVTAQSERMKQQEQQIKEQADYMANLLRSVVPAAPDPELMKTDFVAYVQQETAHKQWMQHLQYLDQQKQLATEKSQAEAAETEKGKADAAYAALLEAVPAYKDEKRLNAFVADIRTYGEKAYGFKPEDLREVATDHRKALVFRDAIAWRKLQASKAKTQPKAEQRPPVQKGGKRMSPEAAQGRTAKAAMERLNKTGSLRDGVAAYLATQKG